MKNTYSFSEMVTTGFALILTKLCYRGARLIRRPFYVRGRKFFQFDQGFTTGHGCRFEMTDQKDDHLKKLIIGKNCKIGDYVHIVASEKVIIGDNCLMASKIFISDTSHGEYGNTSADSMPNIPPDDRTLYSKPVTIGDNVWIGENVCILLGTKIGDGCIIGANSVVNKDIPNNAIVGGVPARIIKIYDEKTQKWIKAV